MRLLFCLVLATLPHCLLAQLLKHVEVGSYVLNSSPSVRQQAGLYLRSGTELLVRDLAGKEVTYSPAQVRSFRVEGREFTVTGGFLVRAGLGDEYVRQAFAERLDSGRVVLLRYESPVGNVPPPGSGNLVYGSGATVVVYLLHRAGEAAVTPVQANWSGRNQHLQAALRPYLTARPDLLGLLDARQLTPTQLPALVRALNSGQPYKP